MIGALESNEQKGASIQEIMNQHIYKKKKKNTCTHAYAQGHVYDNKIENSHKINN